MLCFYYLVTEQMSYPGRIPLSATETFSIVVTNENNNPTIYAAHYGKILTGTVSLSLLPLFLVNFCFSPFLNLHVQFFLFPII